MFAGHLLQPNDATKKELASPGVSVSRGERSASQRISRPQPPLPTTQPSFMKSWICPRQLMLVSWKDYVMCRGGRIGSFVSSSPEESAVWLWGGWYLMKRATHQLKSGVYVSLKGYKQPTAKQWSSSEAKYDNTAFLSNVGKKRLSRQRSTPGPHLRWFVHTPVGVFTLASISYGSCVASMSVWKSMTRMCSG